MADNFSLAAKKREKTKHSARESRADARIPGVVYGSGLKMAEPVSVDYSEFLKLFRQTGQSSLIELDIEGKPSQVLVHSYTLDPVQDTFQHIDFRAVDLKKKTDAHVPLIFEGESNAIKNLGGLLSKNHDELIIRCLPTDIPHDIKIDISGLEETNSVITIGDLNLPKNLEVMHYEESEVLASITEASSGNAGLSEEELAEQAAAEDGAEGEAKSEE